MIGVGSVWFVCRKAYQPELFNYNAIPWRTEVVLIKKYSWDKWVHIFSNAISLNANVIARLEFELAY